MLKETNRVTVVRAFMHQDFPDVLMVKFNDDVVYRVEKLVDSVLLYNIDEELTGVNLLKAPFIKSGYIELDESLQKYIEKRFSLLSLNLEVDTRSYFVCGKVKKLDQHPFSDHLQLCTVDVGDKDVSIVCSAKNVHENMLVVVALPHAILPNGTLITHGKVAGVTSSGMLCSLSDITGGKKTVRGLIELPKGTECGSILDIAGLGETLC